MRTCRLSAFLILAVTLPLAAQETNQPNQLDVLKQAYERQAQASSVQYGKALDAVMADLKKKGDLDNVLILQVEQKRFEVEKTVVTPKDAKDPFRPAAESYHKAIATLLRKYVAALDGLVKKEVAADRIEEAKAVKAEKDKVAFMVADAEANLLAGRGAQETGGVSGQTPPQTVEKPEAAKTAQTTKQAKGDDKSTECSCSASSLTGTEIGTFTKGQKVKIEYVRGKWSVDGAYEANPDDAHGGEDKRLNELSKAQLCKLSEDGALLLLGLIPPNTKRKSFVHTCSEDCTLAIRINDKPGFFSDNSGAVVYRVTITK